MPNAEGGCDFDVCQRDGHLGVVFHALDDPALERGAWNEVAMRLICGRTGLPITRPLDA